MSTVQRRMNVKLWKAFWKLNLYHILFAFLALFLVVPCWTMVEKAPVAFSVLTSLIYGCAIYSIGWNYGRLDARNIPGFYPDKSFPVKAGALGAIIPVILLILCLAFPNIWHINIPFVNGEYEFFLTGNRFRGTTDMIYKLWYFPFEAFLGNGRLVTYILAIFVQPILLIAGYLVGLTKFRILDTLIGNLVFSKKKKQQNQKSPWNR